MEKMRFEKNADMPMHPLEIKICNGATEIYFGLTKREEFAKAAMQAFIEKEGSIDRFLNETTANGNPTMREQMAKASIKCADELLKQLNENT